MASPPFGLNITVPADNDIVSQFPSVNRGDKDTVQSWIKVDHDTNGHHLVINLVEQGSTPAAPAAGILQLYSDTNGNLFTQDTTGTKRYVGVTPGTVSYTAGATADIGYVLANGQAISRTGTGAVLFALLGTTYGSGDGSTTFNVPDIKGRYIVGTDQGAGRVTTAILSSVTNGGTGGFQTSSLVLANLPPYTPSGSITNGTITSMTNNISSGTGGGTTLNISIGGFSASGTFTLAGSGFSMAQNPSTFTGNAQGGTSTPFNTLPPTIVLTPQIKL